MTFYEIIKKGLFKKTVKLLDIFLRTGESTIEEEVLDWYSMSPVERFVESQKLWEVFVLLRGNYDPEPDTQSPFYIYKV